MFRITDYSEIGGKVAMTILYTLDGEPVKDERIYTDKESAMRYFASSAHTMMLFRVSQFSNIIHKIAPHYSEHTDVIPKIRDAHWMQSFWNYESLKKELAKDIQLPHRYCKTILRSITLLESLVPPAIGSAIIPRHDMTLIISDIRTTAAALMKTIEALQDGTFIVESKNIAG